MKLTKIVATIGPSSESEVMIEKLILAGVDVFRFNFKHNEISWHSRMIERVNNVAKKLGKPTATLIDLQGPEVRLYLKNKDKIALKKDQLLKIGEEIYFSHSQIVEKLKEKQKILIDDGHFVFEVMKKEGDFYLKSEQNGLLKNRKTANFPHLDLDFPSLIERDFEGLKLAALHKIDFIALSFVRSEKDIFDLKKEMKKYKVNSKIIAKIETKKAIDNLDEILKEVDGVMVARGDMAVEISWEVVPYYQKMIIKKAREMGKFVITATQMLESMIENPTPTRAEISDIANACFDGTDAVMLSAESASGKYPVEAVSMMKKTLEFNEKFFSEENSKMTDTSKFNWTQIVCQAAFKMYQYLKKERENFGGFLVLTETGNTAITLSRFHPDVAVFAITPYPQVAKFLSICFGVFPFVFPLEKKGKISQEEVDKIIMTTKKTFDIKGTLIVVHGDWWGKIGGTSTVRMVK
jgi:pyruvate kinase